MNKDAMPPKGKINVNLMEAVPRGARVIEHGRDHLICEMAETVEEKEPKRDSEGNVIKKESPDGGFQYPVMEVTEREETVRFKLEARRDGRVVKNYDYRESEEEILRRRAAERRERMLDALEEEMVASGESPEEVARRLVRGRERPVQTAEEPAHNGGEPESEQEPPPVPSEGVSEEQRKRPAPTVEVAGLEARMVRPGVWVSDAFEGEVNGGKDDAREALEEIATAPDAEG